MSQELFICQRCRSPLAVEDLRCPICSLAAPRVEPVDCKKVEVEILRCDGCGAAVSYDVTARAPACAFCGSTMEVEVPTDPTEETERFVPFLVDGKSARASF